MRLCPIIVVTYALSTRMPIRRPHMPAKDRRQPLLSWSVLRQKSDGDGQNRFTSLLKFL